MGSHGEGLYQHSCCLISHRRTLCATSTWPSNSLYSASPSGHALWWSRLGTHNPTQEELRSLHLHLQASKKRLISRQLGLGSLKSIPRVTHTYSNKVTFPVMPFPGPSIYKTLQKPNTKDCSDASSGTL